MIYLVSDIHGCYYTFLSLIKKINLKDTDTIICLGDCIDRGKYSFELLDLFMKNNNYQLIKGNHEFFLELYLDNYLNERDWYNFGGAETIKNLKSLNIDTKLKFFNYIRKLPLYIKHENYIFLHSGFNVELPFIVKDDIILVEETIKKQFSQNSYLYMVSGDINYMPIKKFDKKIIVGHVPTFKISDTSQIYYSSNCINIDCGATYKNGKLGCLRLDDMTEFYVNIKKEDLI